MSLPARVQQILETLRDVQGVAGSFVALGDGRLLSRDMPSLFSDELLMDIAPLIARLGESFVAMEGLDVVGGTLVFQHYTLFLQRLPYGHLCVLGAGDTHRPALSMAMKLVSRRIDSAVMSPPAPPPSPVPAPSPPPRLLDRVRGYLRRGEKVD